MTKRQSGEINLSQALMGVSFKTIAAIGSATGIPWLAGVAALPDALAASETLRSALQQQEPVRIELPAPAFWTRSAQSWQQVCERMEQQFPAILDRVATALHAEALPTDAKVREVLVASISQALPSWDVPAQERNMVASYLARQLFSRAAPKLASVLDSKRQDALLDMTARILQLLQHAQQTPSPADAISTPLLPASGTPANPSTVAATLQAKMQAEAYDVYLCYDEADETEALALGETLKGAGLLPWCEVLTRPGGLRRKEQEQHMMRLPAAAILVGQHGIRHWQELEMYALLDQFVQRDDFPVVPVLLKSASLVATLPPFLATLTWVDCHRAVPDPLAHLIWGITGKRP